jgi:CubicO group peptidase (beta-lactamase class C family)
MTGLHLSSWEMVKIGSLLLEDGVWNNQEIISQSWAKNLLNPTVINTSYNYKMGWFKFGVNHPYFIGENRISQRFVYLWGEGGQFIFILPEHGMVVVFTGGFEPGNEPSYIFEILQKRIIPSILLSSPGT